MYTYLFILYTLVQHYEKPLHVGIENLSSYSTHFFFFLGLPHISVFLLSSHRRCPAPLLPVSPREGVNYVGELQEMTQHGSWPLPDYEDEGTNGRGQFVCTVRLNGLKEQGGCLCGRGALAKWLAAWLGQASSATLGPVSTWMGDHQVLTMWFTLRIYQWTGM